MNEPQARSPAGPQNVREHNLSLVLGALAAHPDGLSRAQLATLTGLTRATAGALADDLMTSGLIVESEPLRGGRGRPGSPLSLDPNGPAGLGIEINVDYVSACVVDLRGQLRVIDTRRVDNRSSEPRTAVRHAAEVARAVALAAGLPIAGICLALPGLVDAAATLRRAPNLSRWVDVDAVSMLLTELGGWATTSSVTVDNEANLAALGQLWYGEPGGLRDFLHVSGEIGIGAGVVLRGELFRGVSGYAGEIGHVVVEPDGPICHCGSRGCLEQLAGQDAILRAAGCPDVAELVAQATAGDPSATAALVRAGSALGVALVSAVNLLDIRQVVLGGIYSRLAPWIVEPVVSGFATRTVSGTWAPIEVAASSLGDDAAVRGAAGTVVHRIVERATRPETTVVVT